jgi:hypothetical protein
VRIVSFKLKPLNPRRNNPRDHMEKRLGGAHSWFGHWGKDRKLFLLLGIQPWFLVRKAPLYTVLAIVIFREQRLYMQCFPSACNFVTLGPILRLSLLSSIPNQRFPWGESLGSHRALNSMVRAIYLTLNFSMNLLLLYYCNSTYSAESSVENIWPQGENLKERWRPRRRWRKT